MTTSNRPPAGTRGTRLEHVVESYPDASLDFIRTSFYLPVDVLQDGRYKVEKIGVASGEEFNKFVADARSSKCKIIGEGASSTMLKHAKQVGISMRTILATNEKIIIAKLWYGNECIPS